MSRPLNTAKSAFLFLCTQMQKRDGNAMRFSDRTCKVREKQQHTTEIHLGHCYGSYKAFFHFAVILNKKLLIESRIFYIY